MNKEQFLEAQEAVRRKIQESLSLLGSGETLSIEGETKITSRERTKYRKGIGTQNYYPSLQKLTEKVISALEDAGLVPIMTNDEEWVGTFTGALSSGETAQLKIEMAKENMRVTNSLVILNIYKMEGSKISYELNTYLS